MNAELLQTISVVAFCASIGFAVVTIWLYFWLDIKGIVADLTGKKAEREIQELRQQNRQVVDAHSYAEVEKLFAGRNEAGVGKPMQPAEGTPSGMLSGGGKSGMLSGVIGKSGVLLGAGGQSGMLSGMGGKSGVLSGVGGRSDDLASSKGAEDETTLLAENQTEVGTALLTENQVEDGTVFLTEEPVEDGTVFLIEEPAEDGTVVLTEDQLEGGGATEQRNQLRMLNNGFWLVVDEIVVHTEERI